MCQSRTKEKLKKISKEIFLIKSDKDFNILALKVFNLQYIHNKAYRQYVDLLQINPKTIRKIKDIPFMPISFFKNHIIKTGDYNHELTFYSSGTTGTNQSKHYIVDKEIYEKSFTKCFKNHYGSPTNYCLLALLPGYLERQGSSLIYMVNELMKLSAHPESGFFLNEFELLEKKIVKLKKLKQKYMIIGVTYALLDFANVCKIDLSDGIIMETGGMKGKRKEIIKPELYSILKSKLKTINIHSEYGMTELLSQSYSKGDGLYECPPWMKVMIRDVYDPFKYVGNNTTGGINVIDLANLYSCSFIETQDLGKINKNDQFEVLGRFDSSDIRGCNLLVS